MAIIWNKIIPRWGGTTIEPPEIKKDEGYLIDDVPPASWENWLRKGTYEALDETRDVIENIDSQLAQKVNKSGDTMSGNLNVPSLNNKVPAYAVTPAATTINSGFATGWSGQIKYRKTQENLLIMEIEDMAKTSTISASDTFYTLPLGDRPSMITKASVIGQDTAGSLVKGSTVEVIITTTGEIRARNMGDISANVTRIQYVTLVQVLA